jgi:hypothetical protein
MQTAPSKLHKHPEAHLDPVMTLLPLRSSGKPGKYEFWHRRQPDLELRGQGLLNCRGVSERWERGEDDLRPYWIFDNALVFNEMQDKKTCQWN